MAQKMASTGHPYEGRLSSNVELIAARLNFAAMSRNRVSIGDRLSDSTPTDDKLPNVYNPLPFREDAPGSTPDGGYLPWAPSKKDDQGTTPFVPADLDEVWRIVDDYEASHRR